MTVLDLEVALRVEPAPRILFERVAELGARPRFMLRDGEEWRAITWAAFGDTVRRTAAWLGQVLAPGDRAAIFAHNRVEWIAAALAVQTVGAVVVPIYPASTDEQAAYVVEHSGAKVLFVAGEEQAARVRAQWPRYATVERVVMLDDLAPADLDQRTIAWSRVQALGAEANAPLARMLDALSLDQPALMLYTSGTTGLPKGVPLTHRNLAVNQADWIRAIAPQLPADPVDLLWLPMSHIFGFGESCIGNALGFTSYLVEPNDVLATMPEVRPSVFMSVPAYWQKLAATAMLADGPEQRRAKLAEITGGRLRFCLSGGAGLAREIKQFFLDCGVLVLEGYGLTECSPTLTLNRPDAFRFDTVGKPLPSVELKLADDGEILARGPSIFAGYHRDPDSTRSAFDDEGWFHTGDVGRWTDDGFLQIVDRKKEILVTAGGKNVPPANIERLFAADPLVKHAVVYGDGKRYLVAGLWLDPEVAAARDADVGQLVEALRERVNGQLARFEQIKRVRVFDEPLTVAGGLLTASLKIRRKQIYAVYRAELEGLYEP
jgi:long-chain acyl-CoA synthetase